MSTTAPTRPVARLGAVALLAALVALAGCGGATTQTGQRQGAFVGVSQMPPQLVGAPAPHTRLADADGRTLDTRDLRGHPYAVTFLYATCPDICPLITQEIVRALDMIGPHAARVTIVAVSVDPRGDTPQTVRTFLRRFDAPPNFRYLLGSYAQLSPVWRAYFAAPQIPGRPTSTHTASVWLVDGRGRLRAKLDGGAPIDPADLAHDLKVLINA